MAKSALKTTTALANPRAAIGGNNPPSDKAQFPAFVPSWDAERCKRIGMSGLSTQIGAKVQLGSAVQRMVASIMGYFSLWHEKGHPLDKPATAKSAAFKVTIHPLSEMAPEKDTKAAQEMRALITAQFFTKLSKEEFSKLPAGEKSKHRTNETNITQLVRRAMKVAAILFMDGITVHDYSDDAGCFRVLPSHLVKAGFQGRGRLANTSNKVLLNNDWMYAVKDEGTDNELMDQFNASVDRVVLIYNLRLDPNYGKRGTVAKPTTFKSDDALAMDTCQKIIDATQASRIGMMVALAKYISDAGTDFAPAALGRQGLEAFTLLAQCYQRLSSRADWKAKVDLLMKAPVPVETKEAA